MAHRRDLVEQLRAAVAGRRASLLPLRWGRMSRTPFDFLRGSAALMARDLGRLPTCGIEVQVCGDAHLLNLGAYAAPDGHLVFDLNDFDESCRGPFEWDLKRLAASVHVGGRVAGHRERDCGAAVRSMVEAYRRALGAFAGLPFLDLARLELTPRASGRRLAPIFREAARDTPGRLIEKATEPDGRGLARFRARPPALTPLEGGEAAWLPEALRRYSETLGPGRRQVFHAYLPRSAASCVAGTGSVGVEDHVVLLYGNGRGDPLFLQLKEQDASCWRPYSRGPRAYARAYPHEGRRAAEAQVRTQTVSDPFLGWAQARGKELLVRQWSDHKGAVSVKLLEDRTALHDYAVLCGRVLAKAHARTGDAAILAGYCGTGGRLDDALAEFAAAYADQAEADHARFLEAIRRGLFEVRDGP